MSRLIYGLVFVILLVLAGCAKAELRCGNFLAQLSDKPDSVEFLGCAQDVDAQGKPFVARYRVTGLDAPEAERYMSHDFGLPTLKFICCGWDSTPYFYRDKSTGLGYMLGMGSEETPINKRDAWPEIKFFYINVSLATEDP